METAREFLTARLRAEPLALGHADLLYPILSTDLDLYRYIPATAPKSLEAVRTRFERLLDGRFPNTEETWLNWVLFCKEDGSVIGTLEATVREPERCALIAYFVFALHRGQGLGTEAVSSLVTWLFATYPWLDCVKAYIDDRNEPSLGLVRKAGLRRVETLRNAEFFDGESRTELVFSISRSDCPAPIPGS